MGAQSRWISRMTGPLDVSRLTRKMSGACSFFAAAGGSLLASFEEEHPLSNRAAIAAAASGNRLRISSSVCHAGRGMSAYDDFAWFYNRYWNEEFHSLAFPILERIWLTRVQPPAH